MNHTAMKYVIDVMWLLVSLLSHQGAAALNKFNFIGKAEKSESIKLHIIFIYFGWLSQSKSTKLRTFFNR